MSSPKTPDRDTLLRQVTVLTQDLEAAVAQARDAEEVLERLEASQSEAAGRLALASRARADLEQRLAEVQAALRIAEREHAEQAYRQALTERDEAAEAGAAAIKHVLAVVEELDQAEAALSVAWDEAIRLGAKLPDALPTEPAVYAHEWSRLEQLLRQKAQWQLERDLVEAAAASPMGDAIKDLPVHLQQLAKDIRRNAIWGAPATQAVPAENENQRSSA